MNNSPELRLPIVPETITVHLGRPDENAPNVELTFNDYIKNVASNEIYPTWPEEALLSNILAQISFALNRVYTEYYRSRGYDFDITNSTAFDQSYVPGSAIFENISDLVDAAFTSYIRRDGRVEPLFAQYCDGIATTCAGLSQWGTADLAENGLNFFEILQNYYGEDIELVENAPVGNVNGSAPPIPLRYGSAGNDVRLLQVRLNRISVNYPSIPKIPLVDGIFDNRTEEAVLEFQRIFGLTRDGIVGNATWYKVRSIYNAVKRLNDLLSEGVDYDEVILQYPSNLGIGDSGQGVLINQYLLNLISEYTPGLEPVEITGQFDGATEQLVRQFQERYGLPVTGRIDNDTFQTIYSQYVGIVESLPPPRGECDTAVYPGYPLRQGFEGEAVALLQFYLNGVGTAFPDVGGLSEDGIFGPLTAAAVAAFAEITGIPSIGLVDAVFWDVLTDVYKQICIGGEYVPGQFPGYDLEETV